MYGVTVCRACGRYRMMDLSVASSDCPFCGSRVVVSASPILFSDRDQSAVRAALATMTGFVPGEKNDRGPDPDPLSTLEYRYEHCGSIEERMSLLAEGLTDIRGSFTLEDVRGIDPKNAENLVRAMVDNCLVSEVSPGRYRGI